MRWTKRPLALALLCLLVSTDTTAQSIESRFRESLHSTTPLADASRSPMLVGPSRGGTRATIVREAPALERARPLAAQGATPSPKRSLTRTILGAIVGATGGFFAGGFTGAWIEGDRCNCDDPGFKGFLIGAPVGAAAGGVLGGLYLF